MILYIPKILEVTVSLKAKTWCLLFDVWMIKVIWSFQKLILKFLSRSLN